MTLAAWPTYDSYRNDIAPWLGDVPSDWPFEKAKWFLSHHKQLNSEGRIDNVLSLTLRGVVNNDPDNPEGLVPKDYRTYQIFEADDLVFKLIDLENVRTSRVGLVHEQGIMSSAYIRIVPPSDWNARFLHYYYFHLYEAEVFNKIGSGVRSTLGQSGLLELPIPIIDRDTQGKIVRLLDEKCAKVDEAVRIKEEQIALLRERRQILIQQAVTRGLNPVAPMKDSGIDWIGQIPAHWDVMSIRYAFKFRNNQRIPLSASEREGKQGEYPYYGASGIIDYVQDYIFEEDLILIAEDGANLLSKSTPLAFVATGKYWVNNHAHILQPLFPGFKYWAEVLSATDYTVYISGAAQPKLTKDRLGSVCVPVPPPEELLAIIEFIERESEKFANAIAIKEEQIAALKEYKTSLINAAVTGKIKVA
ncbi:MAG TPA: restriction endonuclease subunit S [Hyphomonas sp.]|nr:restriction endonuclease subunit S [Hyphomonas sp.]